MAIVVSAACMETQQSGQPWQASRGSGGQAITARRYDKGRWDSVRVRCGHALIGYRHQNCPGRDDEVDAVQRSPTLADLLEAVISSCPWPKYRT